MKSWSAHCVSGLKDPEQPYSRENRKAWIWLYIEEAPWYVFFVRWLSGKMDKLIPQWPLPPIPIKNKWSECDIDGNVTGPPEPEWVPLSEQYPDLNELLYLKVWTRWEFWSYDRIKRIKEVKFDSKEEAKGLMKDKYLDWLFKEANRGDLK